MTRRALGFVAAAAQGACLWMLVAAQIGCHPPASAPPIVPSMPPPGPAVSPQIEIRGESRLTTWTCAGTVCPWGGSLTGQALVWPAALRAIRTRLAYNVSDEIYLPAARANGAIFWCDSGTAKAHAGPPGEEAHRLLATITAGNTLHIDGLASEEVLSVQGDAAFTYHVTLPAPSVPARGGDPAAAPHAIPSIRALWRCNLPGCSASDWSGAVIPWPDGTAYPSNGRSGDASRSVFSDEGKPLYPYMGAWAQGCKVTAEAGVVEVIEWKRGAETWRKTLLFPGQSHVIRLISPEDGAMIETYEGSPGFSASLSNCTPQRLPP